MVGWSVRAIVPWTEVSDHSEVGRRCWLKGRKDRKANCALCNFRSQIPEKDKTEILLGEKTI